MYLLIGIKDEKRKKKTVTLQVVPSILMILKNSTVTGLSEQSHYKWNLMNCFFFPPKENSKS